MTIKIKRTAADEDTGNGGQTCSVCGASIERDPEGEEPRTWHHNDGDKHDHEAKPSGGDKESRRRVARKTAATGSELRAQHSDLFSGADAAYDAEDSSWFESLSMDDLLILWDSVSGNNFIDMEGPWDDEVYDALAAKGYEFPTREGAIDRPTDDDDALPDETIQEAGTAAGYAAAGGGPNMPYDPNADYLPDTGNPGMYYTPDREMTVGTRPRGGARRALNDTGGGGGGGGGLKDFPDDDRDELYSVQPNDPEPEQLDADPNLPFEEGGYLAPVADFLNKFRQVPASKNTAAETTTRETTCSGCLGKGYHIVNGRKVTCAGCQGEGKFTIRSTAADDESSEGGQTCEVCGASIERDPAGEEPRTWHHNDGDKHDHEAKPSGGDKESRRRAAKGTYDEWMAKVDAAVQDKAGLSVHDLSDFPSMDWYEDGVSPSSAASRAIRNDREGSRRTAANPFAKTRPNDNPYEIWTSHDGSWQWYVLKKWQVDDNKPYGRWFCLVKTPYVPEGELGDVYVDEVKANATRTYVDPSITASAKLAGSSDTCPKCGAHMDNVMVYGHKATGQILRAECDACGFVGTKRRPGVGYDSMRKGAPFADYKDFEDCVSKNSDKDDPEAYCGYIKHKVEDKKSMRLAASDDLLSRARSIAESAGSASISRLSGTDLNALADLARSQDDETVKWARTCASAAGSASVSRFSGTDLKKLIDMAKESRKTAGNPHAVGTPAWFRWEYGEGDPASYGPSSGIPRDLFPEGGVPLHGELTPEQEAWLKSRKRSSRSKVAISLTNVGIDGPGVGIGTDPSGARVKFRITEQEEKDLKGVLYSDLAGNFSGVEIDESDIIKDSRKRAVQVDPDYYCPNSPPGGNMCDIGTCERCDAERDRLFAAESREVGRLYDDWAHEGSRRLSAKDIAAANRELQRFASRKTAQDPEPPKITPDPNGEKTVQNGWIKVKGGEPEFNPEVAQLLVDMNHWDRLTFQDLRGATKKRAEHKTEGDFKVQVAGIGENVWSENALRFDSVEEAKAYASDLLGRWFGADMARVVPSDTPTRAAVEPGDAAIVINYRTGMRRRSMAEVNVHELKAGDILIAADGQIDRKNNRVAKVDGFSGMWVIDFTNGTSTPPLGNGKVSVVRERAAAKYRGDLDRSVAFSILLDVMPGYGESVDDGGATITAFLNDWYEDPGTDMYAFAKGWVAGKTARSKRAVKSRNCENGNHSICTGSSCTCSCHAKGTAKDMSGACGDGDHDECQMSHGLGPDDCQCPVCRSKTAARKQARSLSEIAAEIRSDWKNVNFGAVPYLDAMRSLDSINDNYGMDDARSIVLYFLSNATSWRGETAKRIKAELKAMQKGGKLATEDEEEAAHTVRDPRNPRGLYGGDRNILLQDRALELHDEEERRQLEMRQLERSSARSDYAHWNEDADYMWYHEEGKHVEEPPEYDDYDERHFENEPLEEGEESVCENCGGEIVTNEEGDWIGQDDGLWNCPSRPRNQGHVPEDHSMSYAGSRRPFVRSQGLFGFGDPDKWGPVKWIPGTPIDDAIPVDIWEEEHDKEGALLTRTAMPNPVDLGVQVGDIFYSSWGYDQTNVDFYEVTGLTGASVRVRPIAATIESSSGTGQDYLMPVPGSYKGPEFTKRIQGTPGGERSNQPYFRLDSSSGAWLWDGKPKYQTSYGWGH